MNSIPISRLDPRVPVKEKAGWQGGLNVAQRRARDLGILSRYRKGSHDLMIKMMVDCD